MKRISRAGALALCAGSLTLAGVVTAGAAHATSGVRAASRLPLRAAPSSVHVKAEASEGVKGLTLAPKTESAEVADTPTEIKPEAVQVGDHVGPKVTEPTEPVTASDPSVKVPESTTTTHDTADHTAAETADKTADKTADETADDSTESATDDDATDNGDANDQVDNVTDDNGANVTGNNVTDNNAGDHQGDKHAGKHGSNDSVEHTTTTVSGSSTTSNDEGGTDHSD